MKLNHNRAVATGVCAIIGMVVLAATVIAGQPGTREDGALPEDLAQAKFPVGTCLATTSYLIAEPTEQEAVALSASTGWLRPNAAFVGDVTAAAAAFGARVARSGERIAWIENDNGFQRLVRFDLTKGSVWVLTQAIVEASCPSDN